MSSSTATEGSVHEATRLQNTTFNIISQLEREAKFLYSIYNTYMEDARRENRQDIENIWNNIRQDKLKHLQMLREALAKETGEGRVR
jgi:rubrerythrin